MESSISPICDAVVATTRLRGAFKTFPGIGRTGSRLPCLWADSNHDKLTAHTLGKVLSSWEQETFGKTTKWWPLAQSAQSWSATFFCCFGISVCQLIVSVQSKNSENMIDKTFFQKANNVNTHQLKFENSISCEAVKRLAHCSDSMGCWATAKIARNQNQVCIDVRTTSL